MKVHIVTIFPESFSSYFSTSIMGKAQEKKLFEFEFYKLNDFADNATGHIDDKAFGMHGQVLSPEPLKRSIDHIFDSCGKKLPIFYFSPRGRVLTQEAIEGYVALEEFIIICGHYEGIDQRVIDMYDMIQLSIGEYVLSSGELASMVFLDALVRHIPGVLGNEQSLHEESFSKQFNRQKEHPVYTRPRDFYGSRVPDVLVSGNHALIEKWKRDNLSS